MLGHFQHFIKINLNCYALNNSFYGNIQFENNTIHGLGCSGLKRLAFVKTLHTYLLTLPFCAGVSRVRALSPAWTGSPARETVISRTISPQQKNVLPILRVPSVNFQNLRPWKKSTTIKSWPTFCDQYFWKFPIWNSRADEKCREIRMVKVNVIFKWYPVIDLFDTFTGKLGHGD